MEVKILTARFPGDLQDKINRWIKKNKPKSMTISQMTGSMGYSVIIQYEKGDRR